MLRTDPAREPAAEPAARLADAIQLAPSTPAPPSPAGDDVAAAMNRVLAAEHAAQQAVEDARGEAQRILADARRKAREQLQQAERLAQLVHGRAERVASERADRLRAAEVARVCGADDGSERVPAAVRRLAGRLTRGGDG